MIIFLLLAIQISLGIIILFLWRSLVLPLKNKEDKERIEALQIQWEKDRKASRERAKEFNKEK
jgi:hypothetical protein